MSISLFSPAYAETINILPLGDSITQGGRADRAEYSYRYPLFYQLKDAGYDVNFIATLQPILAGAVLVASGFDISLGGNQSPETFTNMRLLFSSIPAGLLLFGLLILWRYPLTREYTGQLKQLLNEARPKSESPGI